MQSRIMQRVCESQRARELVRRYGNQTLSFFALAPNGEGLVSYRLTGNTHCFTLNRSFNPAGRVAIS